MVIQKRIQKFMAGAAAISLMLCGTSAHAYDAEFDYNGDGANDAADLALINAAFNTGEGSPDFNPIFDHDGDGFVGGTDILIAQEALRVDSQ